MEQLICKLLGVIHVLRVRHILGYLSGPLRKNPLPSKHISCIYGNEASALWVQSSELCCSVWKCLCKRAVPPSVCILRARVCVCVMQAIDIQHVQAWERNGRTTMWVEWVMGGKKKVVRMKWSLKNNCIPLWNVCVPAKLQRCRKANSMKMWRRRWIWLYGWAKKECFHPGFSPTFSSNTCNVTSTFLIALTLPAP